MIILIGRPRSCVRLYLNTTDPKFFFPQAKANCEATNGCLMIIKSYEEHLEASALFKQYVFHISVGLFYVTSVLFTQ